MTLWNSNSDIVIIMIIRNKITDVGSEVIETKRSITY